MIFSKIFKDNKISSKLEFNLVIVSIIILFLSINTLSNQIFSSSRLDLTQNDLFTLNKGTVKILNTIDEPITLKLFFSDKLSRNIAPMREYGQRVREIIEEYKNKSNGKIIIERIYPEPVTDNEDMAILYG